jgi:UDP-N-acetylmuramyl pentapeptide phosphotransferase/UDP-N-acetylglucosamine-1-phosphate transferase
LGILIFGYFNFRKQARCFAGDVGSVGIAFILLFMGGCLAWQTKEIGYLVFWCLYGVDTILTIIHRLMLHENIFQAHRKHAYQLMANELHVPHTKVALGYTIVQLMISMGAIGLEKYLLVYMLVVCLVVGMGYVVFMSKYYYLHVNYLKESGK